jgi:hypothetical protein
MRVDGQLGRCLEGRLMLGMSVDKDKVAYVEVSFRPNVELISVVRRFVSDFYARMFKDADATSRVALATHELLENAVRYSRDGETRIRVEVVNDHAHSQVAIRTWNLATPDHVDAVRLLFDEMVSNTDPFHHYQTLMRRTAKVVGGSGLGLARVRAEAEMELSFEVADGILSVGAKTRAEVI